MDRIVMIEKTDGFKYIVGGGRFPADSITHKDGKYYVKTGKRTAIVPENQVTTIEVEEVTNETKQYPSDG